jgi:hypothetical protein
MKLVVESRTPGMMTLPAGSFTLFEQPPFVSVTRVRRLERDARGRGTEDDVDDVGQRDVVMMRALRSCPSTRAGASAPAARWRALDSAPRRGAGPSAELVEAQIGELDVPSHPEVGTVELQTNPARATASYSGRIASAIANR